MKKLLLLLSLSLPAFCQTTQIPDCWQPINTSLLGVQPAYDNSTKGCTLWVFSYASSGFASLSIVVQTAPAIGGAAGSVQPGAWSTFTAVTGANPNTSIISAISTFGTTTAFFPFVRVNLTAASGSGTIQGVLYGWRIPSGGGGGSGCVGTDATPCIVAGPDVAGSPIAGNSVRIGGVDGSGNKRDILTDSLGDVQIQEVGNAAVLSGQQAVTAAAVALATNASKNVCLKALIGNTINVYAGPTGITISTGMELAPGDAVCLPVNNSNLLYVIASTTGASVSWIGTE
jgi:hypothetical protein